jgi:hypothetical protein
MSHTEIANPHVYSASIGPLGAGFFAAAAQPNFNGTSEVISIVRTVLGATVAGTPTAVIISPTSQAANDWLLGIASSTITDVGTYQVNWVNKEVSSSYLSPGILNGVAVTPAVGQYYAP